MKYPMIVTAIAILLSGCGRSAAEAEPSVQVVAQDEEQRVDVLVDGDPFTSYLYSDTLAVLKKPVLFPVYTAAGTPVTRGYPLEPIPGERVDHPHQIGLWFNYGDVNGFDFWNNSDAIPPERAGEMGTVVHRGIDDTQSGEGRGELAVTTEWQTGDGDVILKETTRFIFHAGPQLRIIDRITTLTAEDGPVSFEDNKEGLLGMRVTRSLEMPVTNPVDVIGPDEAVVESSADDDVTGGYVNSEGLNSYPAVWGKRARWMTLAGIIDGDSVTVAMLDHPQNVGYPTHWHARDYGLFAANPLGRSAFTDGTERLGFSLEAGESTTFRYRVLIFNGDVPPEEAERWHRDFSNAEL